MADKIAKLLKKLSYKDYVSIDFALQKIDQNDTDLLDIKKLQGLDLYRVRVGNYRIIFKKVDGKNIIIKILNKDDKTYKNL